MQTRFWIVKKRPDAGSDVMKGSGTYTNKIYKTKEQAEARAKQLAAHYKEGFVVMELVGCYEIESPVRSVEIVSAD